jgi:hypothetical protein
MYYILFYKACEDYENKRMPYRSEHLDLIKKYNEEGYILMAGAYSDPIDGAVIIFKCEDVSLIEDFIAQDPYVNFGLVPEWTIRAWTVVIP